MIVDLFLIIVGIAFLLKGSDLLVDSAAGLATRAGVPIAIVGFSIVATGTSFPELVVGVDSSLGGYGGIALGNVVGANILNICVVLGGAALIRRIKVDPWIAHRDIPLTAAAALLLLLLSLDGVLDLRDGLILLFSFVLYAGYLLWRAKSERAKNITAEAQKIPETRGDRVKGLALLAIGILMAYVGGKVTVDSTIAIAAGLGISSYLVALTLVAIGTTLPETVTGIIASFKDKGDLILGNSLGSISFNILLIIGICAVINPIVVTNRLDILVSLGFCLLLVPLLLRDSTLSKREGAILVLLYAAYVLYKIVAV